MFTAVAEGGGQCGVFWVWRSRSSGRSGGVSAGSGIVGSVPYPEPALACSEKRNVFVKPSAEPNLFRLCRGGKTTVENKRTISLSRVQSSLLELPRREMEHENKGIIEAFRGGRRRPRLFVGAGPFTSPECRPDRASDFGNDGLSSLKGLYFFSVRYCSIDCISCD